MSLISCLMVLKRMEMQQVGRENIDFGFSCTGLGYNVDKPYEYLFNHDTYLYAKHKELNYQIPICHMWRVESARTELKMPVCINGNGNAAPSLDPTRTRLGNKEVYSKTARVSIVSWNLKEAVKIVAGLATVLENSVTGVEPA